jgi:DNA-binding response OmpR family regulator
MNPRNVLVVDDEPHITHVVCLKFRNSGHEVRTAADGEQAFELASRQVPDIIITDLQMPYMDGLELCMKLKQHAPTSAVPVIMLTARGHAISPHDLAQTNIRLVLSKPFSPREVLESAERLMAEGPGSGAVSASRGAA